MMRESRIEQSIMSLISFTIGGLTLLVSLLGPTSPDARDYLLFSILIGGGLFYLINVYIPKSTLIKTSIPYLFLVVTYFYQTLHYEQISFRVMLISFVSGMAIYLITMFSSTGTEDLEEIEELEAFEKNL